MAYATVADMVRRYGEVEMIRLSTPDGQDMETVQAEPIERALSEADDLVDSYLRKRYRVPMDLPPQAVVRAVCILARYDLSTGEQKQVPEQAKTDRKDVVAWLGDIATGKVLLDLEEVAAGDNSFAEAQTRRPVFGSGPVFTAGGYDP